MTVASAVFVRVVLQDRNRGFMLLVGFDAKLVQTTATQLLTLSGLTRKSLDDTIARVKKMYNGSEIRDVTADGIKRRLRDEFNEPHPLTEKQQVALDAKATKLMVVAALDAMKEAA